MQEHRHGVFWRQTQQKMLPRKRDLGFSRIVMYPQGLKVTRSKASLYSQCMTNPKSSLCLETFGDSLGHVTPDWSL